METIYILWQRQLKRYYRSRSRIIGALGQPILFLLALGFGFGPVFQKAGQGNYLQFLTPGIVAQSILFTSVFSGIEIIWDRQFGFLKETLVAPVSRLQIMIGRTIGGATVATIQGLIVLLISFVFGFRIENVLLFPVALIFIVLVALIFTAFGTAVASVLEDIHGFQLIMNFLILPLFFLSGALFPVTDLPAIMNYVVLMNPLTYGVDSIRGALIGVTYYGLLTDFVVLFIVTAVLFAIGSYLFSKIQI